MWGKYQGCDWFINAENLFILEGIVVTDYVIPPPVEKVLPVTRGCDRAFTVKRVDDSGNAVNFSAGTTVYMWVDIDAANPTKVNATVSGANAAFVIDSVVCDQVRNGTRWRAVLDQGDLETPLLVGRFERRDG